MSALASQESLILGTAGHIDHGKSSLIKRLTGVDTDRLEEEKARGITIELGFADITTPSGYHYGIVDVPGHERFVRQMVAGATGVDLALLVIAADDGPMVQTREHLAVLRLLGIKRFIVALTKVDLVYSDWVDLVEEEIRGLLFEERPEIIRVSNETGEGIPELIEALDRHAAEIMALKKQSAKHEFARLPIDRVFSIVGAGTVVTGTLWSGSVAIDDKLESVYSGKEYRVRSIQVHGESVELAKRGNRVALNLVGASKDELKRGDVLAKPGALSTSDSINVEVEYLGLDYLDKSQKSKAKPLKSGTTLRIHHATSEVGASLHLFGEKSLQPGEKAFAQLRLEEKLVTQIGDRFVMRSVSPALTIGGGTVLDPHVRRRSRLSESEFALLTNLKEGSFDEAALLLLKVRESALTSQEVAYALGVNRAEVVDVLNRSSAQKLKVGKETYFMDESYYSRVHRSIEPELLALYDENPDQPDFSIAQLKNRIDPALKAELFEEFLKLALEQSEMTRVRDRIAHKQASSQIEALDEELRAKIMTLLEKQGLNVMTAPELANELGQDKKTVLRVLAGLLQESQVIRLASEFHFTPKNFERAKETLVESLKDATPENPVSAADLRDALGTSRKYLIPILEHFDRQGLTKRVGEGRILA